MITARWVAPISGLPGILVPYVNPEGMYTEVVEAPLALRVPLGVVKKFGKDELEKIMRDAVDRMTQEMNGILEKSNG